MIGAVYAQMFPDRVGRMVLDSPVDLSADALEELRGELGGLRAGARRLPRRLRRQRRSCPFRSDGDPAAALATPRAPLRAGSASSDDRDLATGEERSGRPGVAAFYIALDLRALRQAVRLARARQRASTTPARATAASCSPSPTSYNGRRDDGSYDNIDEVIGVILCDDRDDPVPTFDEYRRRVRPRPRAVPAARRATSGARSSAATPACRARRRREQARRRPRRRRRADPGRRHDARPGHAVRRRAGPRDPARPARAC